MKLRRNPQFPYNRGKFFPNTPIIDHIIYRLDRESTRGIKLPAHGILLPLIKLQIRGNLYHLHPLVHKPVINYSSKREPEILTIPGLPNCFIFMHRE
jgi:hypothetical protein